MSERCYFCKKVLPTRESRLRNVQFKSGNRNIYIKVHKNCAGIFIENDRRIREFEDIKKRIRVAAGLEKDDKAKFFLSFTPETVFGTIPPSDKTHYSIFSPNLQRKAMSHQDADQIDSMRYAVRGNSADIMIIDDPVSDITYDKEKLAEMFDKISETYTKGVLNGTNSNQTPSSANTIGFSHTSGN